MWWKSRSSKVLQLPPLTSHRDLVYFLPSARPCIAFTNSYKSGPMGVHHPVLRAESDLCYRHRWIPFRTSHYCQPRYSLRSGLTLSLQLKPRRKHCSTGPSIVTIQHSVCVESMATWQLQMAIFAIPFLTSLWSIRWPTSKSSDLLQDYSHTASASPSNGAHVLYKGS